MVELSSHDCHTHTARRAERRRGPAPGGILAADSVWLSTGRIKFVSSLCQYVSIAVGFVQHNIMGMRSSWRASD